MKCWNDLNFAIFEQFCIFHQKLFQIYELENITGWKDTCFAQKLQICPLNAI